MSNSNQNKPFTVQPMQAGVATHILYNHSTVNFQRYTDSETRLTEITAPLPNSTGQEYVQCASKTLGFTNVNINKNATQTTIINRNH
jgi:hypothetical protein